ncbi:MAG TPA: alkaline phosphatase family protein [Thermoanaerobaculia bacterium]|jgi:phospholipase C|nr:alkaline phosphatase family protein [Thermoanaerobaculia bacterium]
MPAHSKTKHVVVLMLENRSFDHMFGFLDHPKKFEGLHGKKFTNPDNNKVEIPATPTAGFEVPHDPSHRHFSVMYQLTETDPSGNPKHYKPPYPINMRGFVKEFERHAPGKGAEIMRCQPPGNIPVLATLAKSFALCDHWHASVPGMTWPNRFFAHAAQSSATVNNYLALYGMTTIYHALSKAKKSFKVFDHGDAHARAMPVTWNHRRMMDNFFDRVKKDDLPDYSFIEPNHLGDPAVTNSQHPGKNEPPTGGADFKKGEQLIRSIYRALIANEAVWKKTVFVITYDEHGGFADHVPPPRAVPPNELMSPERFGFDLLGVRVPAVIVSPYIKAATVDSTVYDHSSIVASVREQFGIAKALTERDANAKTFWHNLTLAEPRLGAAIPTLEDSGFEALESMAEAVSVDAPAPAEDDFDMVWIAQQLDRVMAAKEAAKIESPKAMTEAMAAPVKESFDTTRDVGEYAQQVDKRFKNPPDWKKYR